MARGKDVAAGLQRLRRRQNQFTRRAPAYGERHRIAVEIEQAVGTGGIHSCGAHPQCQQVTRVKTQRVGGKRLLWIGPGKQLDRSAGSGEELARHLPRETALVRIPDGAPSDAGHCGHKRQRHQQEAIAPIDTATRVR